MRDLLDQGWPGEVIRFVFLQTHYSKPMDWTVEKSVTAHAKIHGFIEMIALYGDLEGVDNSQPETAIVDALSDDLNTHAALEALSKMNDAGSATRLARNLVFLGIFSEATLAARVRDYRHGLELLKEKAAELQALREEAMRSKDFSRVDRYKYMLSRANVSVQMTSTGVHLRPEMDFDPAMLEALK